MAPARAYFTAAGAGYLPTRLAHSRWGPNHLSGPAVVGLVARELENKCGSDDLHPARLTVDLFRAARDEHTVLDVAVVRDGHRVRHAQCDVVQGDRIIARASLTQYRRSSAPPGRLWRARTTALDGLPVIDGSAEPYVGSDAAGWTRSAAGHQNDSRKRFVHSGFDVLAGETNSAFVRSSVVAESTSLVTNLGSAGIGYINGDLTVALSRLPIDDWVGVQADAHLAAGGVAVGTTTLFDSRGPFGAGVTTAIANPDAQIQFSAD